MPVQKLAMPTRNTNKKYYTNKEILFFISIQFSFIKS